MAPDFEIISTQKSVLGTLMDSPFFRGEVIQKYPERLATFFSTPEAVKLLKGIMACQGRAYPAAVEPKVPDLINTPWAPQDIWDAHDLDAPTRFWDEIEILRRFAKRREFDKMLAAQTAKLKDPDIDVDVLTSETSALISKLSADSSMAYDPTMAAVIERWRIARAEGKIGIKLPTAVRKLNEGLVGGLRTNPGELVVISGREKQRKTTLVFNIVAAWHRQGVPGATLWISNEQSMNASDLFGHLWALEATYLAYKDGILDHKGNPYHFSKDGVLAAEWQAGSQQKGLVDRALQVVGRWDIRFYCAAANEGNAMNAEAVCAVARTDIEFNGVQRVIVDNLQGFRQSDEDDYAVMNRVVPLVDAFTGTQECLTIALSQLSRKSKDGGGQIKGGGGLEGRANLVLETAYNDQATPGHMTVTRTWGRNRPYFQEDLAIEPNSGLLIEDFARAARASTAI